jgi:hypothetical protein
MVVMEATVRLSLRLVNLVIVMVRHSTPGLKILMEVDQRAIRVLNSARTPPHITTRSVTRPADTPSRLRLTLAIVVPSNAPSTRLIAMEALVAMTTAMVVVKNRVTEALVVMKTAMPVVTSKVMAAAAVTKMKVTVVANSKIMGAHAETMTAIVVVSSRATVVETKMKAPLVVMSTEHPVADTARAEDMAAALTAGRRVVDMASAKSMAAPAEARSTDLLVPMADRKSHMAALDAVMETMTKQMTIAVAVMMKDTVSRAATINQAVTAVVAMAGRVVTTTTPAMAVAAIER